MRTKIAAAALVLIWATLAAAQSPATPATQPDSPPLLRLFSVGDWGIDSPDRQTVADRMAERTTAPDASPPNAVLLLGDNYYVKLSSIADPQIQKFFEQTYDAKRLNVPFYAVLGNHDYTNNNVQIELKYAAVGKSRFTIPSPYYRLDLPLGHPIATVLMLDSDQPYMNADAWTTETAWIESELQKPHAQWLMCCAHHDMFGNGSQGDNGVLMTTWGTLFKKYGVDFYVCGHEHSLEHLEIPKWPISFVVAGGGGAARKPMLKDKRGPFSRSILGFADVEFFDQYAVVSLIDGDGKVEHEFRRDKNGTVTTLANTPSDQATTHKLRVINGGN